MILLAQQGLSNDQIADRLSTRREIVSRWRKRFFTNFGTPLPQKCSVLGLAFPP
jgi:transposase-like protein